MDMMNTTHAVNMMNTTHAVDMMNTAHAVDMMNTTHVVDMMNTTHAELRKLFYADMGLHEMEILFEGEVAGPLSSRTSCAKNPSHKGFIAVKDFKMEHLPFCYRDKHHFELVKAQANLTVCLKMNKFNQYRNDNPPPNNPNKYINGTAWGTGFITYVSKYTEKENQRCECSSCSKSSQPHTTWGAIEIMTAAHVIFDNIESGDTVCHLFYDTPGEDPGKYWTLHGLQIVERNSEGDTCITRHVTHDIDKVDKISKMLQHYNDVHERLYGPSSNVIMRYLDKFITLEPTLTVVTAHPHGCSKHISLGEIKSRCWESFGRVAYHKYTAVTCQGCSGAPVNILGTMDLNSTWCNRPHRAKSQHLSVNTSGTVAFQRGNPYLGLLLTAISLLCIILLMILEDNMIGGYAYRFSTVLGTELMLVSLILWSRWSWHYVLTYAVFIAFRPKWMTKALLTVLFGLPVFCDVVSYFNCLTIKVGRLLLFLWVGLVLSPWTWITNTLVYVIIIVSLYLRSKPWEPEKYSTGRWSLVLMCLCILLSLMLWWKGAPYLSCCFTTAMQTSRFDTYRDKKYVTLMLFLCVFLIVLALVIAEFI